MSNRVSSETRYDSPSAKKGTVRPRVKRNPPIGGPNKLAARNSCLVLGQRFSVLLLVNDYPDGRNLAQAEEDKQAALNERCDGDL